MRDNRLKGENMPAQGIALGWIITAFQATPTEVDDNWKRTK
jgi:hypothetical protein